MTISTLSQARPVIWRRVAAALVMAAGAAAARGQCVQQWDGDFGIPAGLDGPVYSMLNWDPDGTGPLPAQLVAAGAFGTGSGVQLNKIGMWNGVTWVPFAGGIGTNSAVAVLCMVIFDPDGSGPQPGQLIIGGHFANVPGNFVQRWDPAAQAWQPLGTGMNNDVRSLTVWDPDGDGPFPPQLVAGGDFTTAGGVTVNHVARWDGAAWQPLGAGINQGSVTVTSVSTYDPDGAGPMPPQLVAAGSFTVAGGNTINRIARFDGTTWQGFGTGMNSTVWVLSHWDPGSGDELIAAGDFTNAGGTAASGIARWTGSSWQALGAGMVGSTRTLTTWDPDGPGPMPTQLVAGGLFTMAGGNAIPRIAHWDGSTWQAFGTGVNGSGVYSVATFDPDGAGPDYPQLVAGGDFTLAAGNLANRIAAWISSPTPVVITSPANTLACAGSSSSAFTVRAAAGAFPTYQWRKNGAPLTDGATGTGSSITGATSITLTITTPSPADVAQYDVIVTNACGIATSGAAALTRCFANCDCSSTAPILNVGDFLCFQSRFAAGDTAANCDGSTTPPVLNVGDFICFQTKFASGCP